MKERQEGILHIATDEKFINSGNSVFTKAFPDLTNDFYIVQLNGREQLTHVKMEANFHVVESSVETINFLSKIMANYQLVVFHYLSEFSFRLIGKIPTDVKILWLIWGGELYESEIYNGDLYGLLTQGVTKKTPLQQIRVWLSFFKLGLLKFQKFTFSRKLMKRHAFRRFNYIGCLAIEEFELLNHSFFQENAKHIRFSYLPIDFAFRESLPMTISGNNILLGNSATPTNNHLEALGLLRKMDIGDRVIITPLSYGDAMYAQLIKEKGEELFKNQFLPLMEYVSLDEYHDLISSCSVVIMNHYRQQALGNIFSMLWLGAKVFLSERSILFPYFSRLGFTFYSIESDLNAQNTNALNPLTKAQQIKNRKLVWANQSSAKIISEFRTDLVALLDKE